MRERLLLLLDRLMRSPSGTGFERLCAEAYLRAGAEMRGQAIVDRWLAMARGGPSPEGVYVLCWFARLFARLERMERAIALVEEAARMPRVLDPARTAERHLDLAAAYASVRRPGDARLQLDVARDEGLLQALDLESRIDHLARLAAALLEDARDPGAARETFARAVVLESGLEHQDPLRVHAFARTAARLGLEEEVERRLARLDAEDVAPVLGDLAGAVPDRLDRLRERVDADAGPHRTARMIALAGGIAGHPERAAVARELLEEALQRVQEEPAPRRWRSLVRASEVVGAHLADAAGGLRLAREALDAFASVPDGTQGWGSWAELVAGALIGAGDLGRGLALAERRLGAAPGSAACVGVALLCRDAAEVIARGPRPGRAAR